MVSEAMSAQAALAAVMIYVSCSLVAAPLLRWAGRALEVPGKCRMVLRASHNPHARRAAAFLLRDDALETAGRGFLLALSSSLLMLQLLRLAFG